MKRENQPISNSYSAPTTKEDASSCRPSKVTPRDISKRPQFDVSMRTAGVDADPLDPPDAVSGSADTTTQRTLSTVIASHTGLISTPTTTTTIRRKTTQYNHSAVGFFVAVGVAWTPVVGASELVMVFPPGMCRCPLSVLAGGVVLGRVSAESDSANRLMAATSSRVSPTVVASLNVKFADHSTGR